MIAERLTFIRVLWLNEVESTWHTRDSSNREVKNFEWPQRWLVISLFPSLYMPINRLLWIILRDVYLKYK